MGKRLKTVKKRLGKVVKFGKKVAKGASKAYEKFYRGVDIVQKGARKIQKYGYDFEDLIGSSEAEIPQIDVGFDMFSSSRRKRKKNDSFFW